ncbi:MAG: hypothetical protein MUF15_05725 [Acidobacteria bacterium]|jgi:hypothetical protein|nr:hypothetical protein [Acidobacteriota bacterium]
MKKVIKIISFNIALLVVLMVILEVILRLAGMNSIYQMERKAPGWESRYKHLCEKINREKVNFYNSFYTDNEGIFKANPDFFANSQRKNKDICINSEGFRSTPFQYVQTSRPKILLIGDSFTWGGTAQPITNSFADLLHKAGYYVYNGGIPGTDPQQYALVAKKYTPILKPDVVAVCLYLGNDVGSRPLLIKPNKNIHYVTDFGYLLGYDDNGNFFKDAPGAFQYFKNRKCGCCKDPWNYFLFKTIVGKAVYKILHLRRHTKFDSSRQWVTTALTDIQETCRLNGSRFMIFIIPFVNRANQPNKTIEKTRHLYKDFPYYYPGDFPKSHYQSPPDKHFNNQGHREFADFIITVLKQNGYFAPAQEKDITP